MFTTTTMVNNGHPDRSWYLDSVDALPEFPQAYHDIRASVAIIGGGYTGLGAALELAKRGIDVVLLEGAQIGSGASGRNGGQIHTGQRLDPQSLEALVGKTDTHALWYMAEDAKRDLLQLIDTHHIACDLKHGLIHAWHRRKLGDEDRDYIRHIRLNYGYNSIEVLSFGDVAKQLGTNVYHGGSLDHGAGHLHPLKLALGLAVAADGAGARIFEQSPVVRIDRQTNLVDLHLSNGRHVRCDHVLLCGNGYMEGLNETVDSHVMPINNFILATEPLDDESILPENFAVADTRFVVNYFRKTPDNRLLFGGGENYSPEFPQDIAAFVRNNMLKIYPQLKDVAITHAWGGTLGITMKRMPYVRALHDNVWVSAGYSGQGVVLAPYFGKLMAKALLGEGKDFELLSRIPTPPFFGGRRFRNPLLVAGLTYYALRDRLG
jgi:gamma-glutamylputrescine oxidase